MTVVEFTMGRKSVEFDPEDMTEKQIEEFQNAPIIEKVRVWEYVYCIHILCMYVYTFNVSLHTYVHMFVGVYVLYIYVHI